MLYVRMCKQMILTVFPIADAFAAIAEFQLRVRHIRAATHGAAVVVILFFLLLVGLLGDVELDDLRPGGLGLHLKELLQLHAEATGEDVQHIGAKEQEIVGNGNDGEQVIGESVLNHGEQHQHQLQNGKEPGFHRDNHKQQKACVREHGGIGQK